MANEGIELHVKARPVAELPPGPLDRLSDGTVVAVGKGEVVRTPDLGHTWETFPLEHDAEEFAVEIDHSLMTSRQDDVLILSLLNVAQRIGLDWDKETSSVPETTQLPHYVARSLDGGRTWTDVQMLHRDWTGDARDIIQLESGRIVLTSMKMIRKPGRHTVLTYWSDDNGLTWTPSNIIDLGGIGHHGGVSESSIVELKDGRIWMLLRTNWGVFWEAFSEDGGTSWRTIRPSKIEAATAPPLLKRLESGRIMLLWNRPRPDDGTEVELYGGDNQWSEVAASNYRAQLSLAFSEDEGETWTEPAVLADISNFEGKRKWISYPWACEVAPGHLWATSMQGHLAAEFYEKDFV